MIEETWRQEGSLGLATPTRETIEVSTFPTRPKEDTQQNILECSQIRRSTACKAVMKRVLGESVVEERHCATPEPLKLLQTTAGGIVSVLLKRSKMNFVLKYSFIEFGSEGYCVLCICAGGKVLWPW